MAKVNKKRMISQQQGLPTIEAIMMDKAGDTVPAKINNTNGSQSPASLTEGEFVWSIPAIIALGQGDYAEGLNVLEQMHTELQALGEQMMDEISGGVQGGLAGTV